MSGFVKKVKKRAGRLIDNLHPGSQAPSPKLPDPEPAPPMPAPGGHAYAAPPPPPTDLSTAGSIIHELLAAARDGSDLCLPLKAALVGVVKIWDVCERTAQVKDEHKQLESRLARLLAVTQAYGKRGHLDVNLKQRLDNISSTLEHLSISIELKLERGTTKRMLESNADVAEVKEILLKISARIEAFLYESMIRVEIGVDAILSSLPTAEETEMAKELSKIMHVLTSTLGGRRVHEAAHDAQPKNAGCMPGTRVNVLSKLAGTGKTSVAVTLCRMLESDPEVLLGGTFFCSRTANVEGRTDVRRILPSLSASLADRSPRFAADLASELKPHSGAAANKPVSDQDPLLQRPISALAGDTRPIVFVIDALDECSDERELAELLAGITRLKCNANVKFILTSRPETHILGSPISVRHQNEILQLHMIDAAEVTEDIALYIEDAFSKSPLTRPWYYGNDVIALSNLSDGLFIFASTIVAYILDTRSVQGRTTRLRTAVEAVSKSAVAMGPLDAMYEFVVTRATSTIKVEPEELKATQRVLASILVARAPLSARALAELLGLEVDFMRESLQRLHAILNVPEADDEPALRTLHASFGDYMLTRAAHNIRIVESLGHDALARGCLNRMAWDDLCFNVSRSRSSYEDNYLASGDHIELSLVYACLHWAHHIVYAFDSSEFDSMIEQWFVPKFLFWLEVLSILGMVGVASGLLRLAGIIANRDVVSRFLREANSFVASSRDAIEWSTPHIYLSALPFAAKDSLVYRTFAPLYTDLVSVELFGVDHHGGRLLMTLIGHEGGVYSAMYSSDGRFLVSGSEDGTVRRWDTLTGDATTISLRRGNDGKIQSVAFTANRKSIATGTDTGAILIWDLSTSQPTALHLSGHSHKVVSVAFSPNDSILASASDDVTTRLWRVETGQNIAILDGQPCVTGAIAFSPDGLILASGSFEDTILLYNAGTGEPATQPLDGQNCPVYSICFSPDSKMLASGCGHNIVLWDTQNARKIMNLLGDLNFEAASVQFSSDGRSLVSAAFDGTIRLWTIPHEVGQAVSIAFYGHSGLTHCATFSPDGQHVASGSDDGTIRIWDSGSSNLETSPLSAHNGIVFSAVVSQDGSLIVSGSQDCSVRVWDALTGEPKLPPLQHPNKVFSVAISSDGLLIASASLDCMIRIWNAHTGDAVCEPLQGHESAVSEVSFCPNTQTLASGSRDGTVRTWNGETGSPYIANPLECRGEVFAVAYSPDGRLLAAGDTSGYVHIWLAVSCQTVSQLFRESHSIACVAFSPSSTQIVSSDLERVIVWDVITGEQIVFLETDSSLTRAIFSPDGQLICTGSDDKVVRLWDAATGAFIAALHGHAGSVRTIAFTSDGDSIVSGAEDGTIRVWDVAAACSLRSENRRSLETALTTRGLENGWLLGRSGELLLWIPEEYRAYLYVPPCTNLIASRRIVLTEGEDDLRRGENWTACWRNNTPTLPSHGV